MNKTVDPSPKTFTDFMRTTFKGVALPIARLLNRMGMTPNMVTLAGLAGQMVAAGLLAFGQMTWGGILLVVVAPLDFLDGTLARLRGTPTHFGAFLDSVTDRYAELSIFGGLLVYYTHQQDWVLCGMTYLAAMGSLMVSYVRARAEGVGYSAKIGLLSRVERYLILVPLLIFNQPYWAVLILAVLTNFTALQRIFHVYDQARKDPNAIIKS